MQDTGMDKRLSRGVLERQDKEKDQYRNTFHGSGSIIRLKPPEGSRSKCGRDLDVSRI